MDEENNFLRQVPIFSDLDEKTIEEILKLGRRKNFDKDDSVLLEHETGVTQDDLKQASLRLAHDASLYTINVWVDSTERKNYNR